MKARRKGDTTPFEDVYKIVIGRGLNAEYIPINEVEFEQQQEPPSHWQAVREMAAITALQGFISSPKFDRFSKTFIAEEAVKCADALVEKLKGE